MRYKPLGARVLVKQLDADEETDGGIIIPDSARERPPEGLIVAVGADCKWLESGMRVVFRKWSSRAWTLRGEDDDDLIVMDEDQALAVAVHDG